MARDTWLPTRGPGRSAFEQTFRLRPELHEGYEALRAEIVRESGLDETLVARCAARVAWLLTAEGEPPQPIGDQEGAVFAFVDKFVRDPHGVTDDDVAALRATMSPAAGRRAHGDDGAARRLHALSSDPRCGRDVMARLPAPVTTASDPLATSVLGHLPASLAAFQRLYGRLWRSHVLDPVTKEIARMRNARITDCGYCKNVRFGVAREAGLDEETLALVTDTYEDSSLSARHKTALRFVDVFLTDPTALRASDREALLAAFTPAEIVELAAATALFVGFSKIAVVLGTAPAGMPLTVVPIPGDGC